MLEHRLQIQSIKSINDFFNKSNRFFKNFKYTEFLKSKVNHFSLPQIEFGALDVVLEVFGSKNDYIHSGSSITANDVKDADKSEVYVYCKEKNFSSEIDWNVVYKYHWEFIKKLGLDKVTFNCSLSFEQICLMLPKDTSSGYPLFCKKGLTKSVNYAFKLFDEVIKHPYCDGKLNLLMLHPTTIFHRFSPKVKRKGNNISNSYKIRQIFGVPQFICILEVYLFHEFVTLFKKCFAEVYTLGDNRVQVSDKIQNVRKNAYYNNSYILCGDIKGCDKSISAEFHKLLFSSLYNGFKNRNLRKIFLAVAKYLTYTPILSVRLKNDVSNGSTVTGSWITSIFTTFCVNFALNYSYYKIYGRFLSSGEYLIQGDDFIISLEKEEDLNLLIKFMSHFNLTLKGEEQKLASSQDQIEFLGYFWDVNGEPDQTDEWFIAHILFPERFAKFPSFDRIISRYLSLIFQVKRFKQLFLKFLKADTLLRYRYKYSDRPYFKIIDDRGNVTEQLFPIDTFLKNGWTMF